MQIRTEHLILSNLPQDECALRTTSGSLSGHV
jgi:hypothetical protein